MDDEDRLPTVRASLEDAEPAVRRSPARDDVDDIGEVGLVGGREGIPHPELDLSLIHI